MLQQLMYKIIGSVNEGNNLRVSCHILNNKLKWGWHFSTHDTPCQGVYQKGMYIPRVHRENFVHHNNREVTVGHQLFLIYSLIYHIVINCHKRN